MKRFYILSALIVLVLNTLLGCANNRYLIPKELRDTKLAVENARIMGKDLKCPDAYHEVWTLWRETLEAYENPCDADEDWAVKATIVREKAGGLCPEPERYAVTEKAGIEREPLPLDSDGDGVPDMLDKCPDTANNIVVDKNGCPEDTDGDGIPDYLDRCPGTPKCAKVNGMGCWVLENVNFDFDKWNIKSQFISNLNDVADCLKINPRIYLGLHGHADIIGTQEYNQELSEKRAYSVKEYLIKRGIAQERLSTKGFSFNRPIATNKTEEGRAKNRRVEFSPNK